MDYKDYNDYEIIYYIRENNEEAKDLMYEKYKPFIEITAKKLIDYSQNTGLEVSDFIQEGMLALNSAIESFNEEKDVTFYNYARACIEKKMISLMVKNKSDKHKILNDSVPFEINDTDGEHLMFGDILEDKGANPEDLIIDNEEENILLNRIRNSLTDFENQVFDLKLSGFTYKEIASILEKSPKSIDNSIQRIKIKAKEQIDKIKKESN